MVLIAVYVGMTLAYHYLLPMDELASSSGDSKHIEKAAAAVYCKTLLGTPGVVAVSILVMCSTFISLNGNALTGPRAYFAMARDRLFPGSLCRVHPRFQTPANAILSQGIWSILLTIAGTWLILVPPPDSDRSIFLTVARSWLILVPPPDSGSRLAGPIVVAWKQLNQTPLYDLLYTYVIFGANLFYMLAIGSVFVLRVRRPDLARPYRTLGYPVTPLLFVAGVLILLGSMLVDHASRVQSLVGIGIILLGLPAYWVFRWANRAERSDLAGS